MRHSGSWQSVWDDRILEWIREHDGSGTAAEMKRDDAIRIQRPSISRRLQKLAEHGLVVDVGNGAYLITEEGEGYLDEKYDVEKGVWLDHDHADVDGPTGTDTPTGPNGA